MAKIIKENLNGWAISDALVEWLLQNLPTGSTILELGSGKGTIELCKFYKMYSIEHNIDWLNKSQSNYIYAPIKSYGSYNWFDKDAIIKNIPKDYDLILVDGPPGNIGRMGFVNNIEIFNTSVPIIIDDSNRPDERMLVKELQTKLGRDIEDYIGFEKGFSIIKSN